MGAGPARAAAGTLARTLAATAAAGLCLFGPAGTTDWPQAWCLLALLGGCGAATGTWLAFADPDLHAARRASPLAPGQALPDRAIGGAITLACGAWLPLMAVQARMSGTDALPTWANVAGGALVAVAFAGWAWCLSVNTFAETAVRLQPERGQEVVEAGPYGIVRHPMYAFAVPLAAGVPMLLGAPAGWALGAVALALLAARLVREERMLAEGLPGYRDYARRVRSRMVPGLW